MTNRAKNMSSVTPGGTITLDVYFKAFLGGPLVDPIPAPTYTFLDPNNNVIATGTGTKISTGHYEASLATTIYYAYSDYYKIEWTAYVGGVQVPNAWEYWRVVSPGSTDFSPIVISDARLNQIKKVLAYPKVSNILLSNDEIKQLCIEPAMRLYFTKFPKVQEIDYEIGYTTEVTYSFPDSYTFGVLDLRVTNTNITSATGGFSNFLNLAAWAQTSIVNRASYGIKGYNPNFLSQQKFTEQQSLYAMREMNKTIRHKIDVDNRKITVFSNMAGKLYINWAKYSDNFDDIKFQYIEDVIKLSQSYLLSHFCDTTDIVTNSDMTLNINTDLLKTRADELKTEVIDKWNEISSVSLLRY